VRRDHLEPARREGPRLRMTPSLRAEDVRLVRPAAELVASYLDLLEEMAALGERVWPARPEPGETWEDFALRLVRADSAQEAEGPPRVPQTTYWATLDAKVVGHIGLRHRLNAELAEFGGHVGYDVRPSSRGHGIAKEMLRQILQTPKAREIGRLLLTCAPDNVASNRVIVANGGVLERTIFVERIARETNLYWITL
jgi:predicted acetyltransferase